MNDPYAPMSLRLLAGVQKSEEDRDFAHSCADAWEAAQKRIAELDAEVQKVRNLLLSHDKIRRKVEEGALEAIQENYQFKNRIAELEAQLSERSRADGD